MKIFNDNWVTSVFQILTAVLVVCFVVVVILIFSHATPDQGAEVAIRDYVTFDEGVDIADRIVSFNLDQSRQFTLQGKPRMVTPEAIIDFSGDKVTYSGDLPVDEAAKVFFDAVLGYVKEAEECKNESK